MYSALAKRVSCTHFWKDPIPYTRHACLKKPFPRFRYIPVRAGSDCATLGLNSLDDAMLAKSLPRILKCLFFNPTHLSLFFNLHKQIHNSQFEPPVATSITNLLVIAAMQTQRGIRSHHVSLKSRLHLPAQVAGLLRVCLGTKWVIFYDPVVVVTSLI